MLQCFVLNSNSLKWKRELVIGSSQYSLWRLVINDYHIGK